MQSRTFFCAAVILALGACGPTRPILPNDGGADGSAACTSNAECNDNTPCTRDLCLVGGVCEHTPDNSMCAAGQMCVSGRGCTAGGARTCRAASECDDRIACTRDSCLVEGVCRNQPDDTQCTGGQVCNPASGCGASTNCTTNAQCNDNVDCTEDTCTVSGMCEHVPQNSRCMGGRTCNTTMGCIMATACRGNAECDDGNYCNGAETCNTELACVAGTPVACADSDPCTIDSCDNGSRMCTHTMDMACSGSAIRGIYDITPSTMYSCTDSFIGMTLIDYNIRFFEFNESGGQLVVQGAPAIMRGAIPAMGATMFDVSGVIAGSCSENYRLAGSFTDATRTAFTGTFTLSLTPAGTCSAVSTCRDQSVMVSGRRR